MYRWLENHASRWRLNCTEQIGCGKLQSARLLKVSLGYTAQYTDNCVPGKELLMETGEDACQLLKILPGLENPEIWSPEDELK
jgi:hypothetical protein